MDTTRAHHGQYHLDAESLDLLGSDPIPFPADNRAVALGLARRGLAVFPIRDWGDGDEWKPIAAFPNKATSDPDHVSRWWKKWPESRVGLVTGRRNGITVLDVDIKNGKDGQATLADLGFPDLSSLSPCRVRTPSGGWHLIFDYAPELKNSVGKIGAGLDLKTDGGFIVAPGSFKAGACYVPEGEALARDSVLPALPAALRRLAPSHDNDDFADLLGGCVVPVVTASCYQKEWAEDRLAELAEEVATAPEGQRHDTLNAHAFLCGGYGAHGALTEEQARGQLIPAALSCGLSEREAEKTFLHAWADGLKKPAELPKDCEDEFDDQESIGTASAPQRSRQVARASAVPAVERLMRNEGGSLYSNATNAIALLSKDVQHILPGLRHNLMTGRDEWGNGDVDDSTIMLARVALEQRGLRTIGKELVSDAVATVAKLRQRHPIRDWLDGLTHDGTARLGSWLNRYMGADDTPYSAAVGRAFLISMVARIMQPGSKADHMIVLTGPQGIGKSSACRILAGDEYFSDSLPAITSDKREAVMHLSGKWLIEIGELAPVRRSEAEDLKAFFSGAVDKVRMPYARRDQILQRQCVFIGTTNDDEFLNDATGGRRYWPVTLQRPIDLAALVDDREQLFAEAMAAYRQGEQWWLDRDFERQHAEPVRKMAEISDPWEDQIIPYLEEGGDDLDDDHMPRQEVVVVDILRRVVGVPDERHTRAVQKRVTDILKRHGFSRHHTRKGKVWRRDP